MDASPSLGHWDFEWPRISPKPFMPPLRPPARCVAYEIIDGERDYQDLRWGGLAHDNEHSIDEWALYIRGYADELTSKAGNTLDDHERLAIVRKIAALCVACMETHLAPRRVPPGASCEIPVPDPEVAPELGANFDPEAVPDPEADGEPPTPPHLTQDDSSRVISPDVTVRDISHEEYRLYRYNDPHRSDIRIWNPVKLAYKDPESHRVLDSSGVWHYIPRGWRAISWRGPVAF